MKNITEIVNDIDLTKRKEKTPLDLQTKEIVNDIFYRLAGIFTAHCAAWPDTKSVNACKNQYYLALKENGITDLELIKLAFKKARIASALKPFIPTAGQFVLWCKPAPQDLGLLDTKSAFMQATKNASPYETVKHWTHKTIRHAAHATGLYEIRINATDKIFPVFEKNYLYAIELFSKGKLLDEISSDNTEALQAENKKRDNVTMDNYKDLKNHSAALNTLKRLLR